MEDCAIIALYWDRDEAAIARSQEKYGGYCRTVAGRLLASPQDAEECVSDTWLAAWGSMPPHRPQALRMFFAKLTRRLAFNRYKANTAEKRGGGQLPQVLEELSECVAGSEDVQQQVEDRELGRLVRDFVHALPQRERDLFLRRYFFAEPVKEIALRYGITANHASVILRRARGKLRAELEKEGYL